MSSQYHQHHHTHNHQDPELAHQMRRQADLTEQRLSLEQQRFEFERQAQRARDLGITHEEYTRRMADAEQARGELAQVQGEEDVGKQRVRRAQMDVSNQAWRERMELHWRNRWNWLRHPLLTRNAIRPYAQLIEPRLIAASLPLRQAQQDLLSFPARIHVAQQRVHQCEARL
jgi:hypothetical protein